MDLTSLKSMLAYKPSLIDYMGGGRTNVFDTLSRARTAGLPAAAQNAGVAGDSGITLSPEAQAILAADNADGSANPSLSGVQKGAQDFFMGFFDASDIDLTRLSDEMLELIKGFQSVIADSGAVQRDMATDALESRHHDGNRRAYTLVGPGSRLRIAIDYDDAGAPQKMSITDILNGTVNLADITVNDDQTVLLERARRSYAKGTMVDAETKMPLTLRLYGA